jgi:hypothetical protein
MHYPSPHPSAHLGNTSRIAQGNVFQQHQDGSCIVKDWSALQHKRDVEDSLHSSNKVHLPRRLLTKFGEVHS